MEREVIDVYIANATISMVGSPPEGLIRVGDEISAQLKSAHYRICAPAMQTDKW